MIATEVVRRRIVPSTLVALVIFAAACGDDPAAPIPGAGDPENISRVTISLTPAAGGSAITSARVDPDGTTLPKPVGAAQGTLTLTKGTTYNGTVTLLNDLDSKNVIDITQEVKKEANFHRFFYSFTPAASCAGVSVPDASLDLDTQATPAPVGLKFQVVVTSAAASTTTCNLHVELHHFEQAKGNGLGTTFDTDLSIDFPVTIS
jgi:hypothetical protein